MTIAHRVAGNTGIIIAANAVSGLVGMLATIYTVRYLGADMFGAFSFVLTYIGFFAIITELVATQIVVREISRGSASSELAGNVIVMKAVLSFFAVASACAAARLFGYPPDTRALIYIASASLFLSFGSVYIAIFRSRLRMFYPMLVEVLTAVIKLTLVLYLVRAGSPVSYFIIAGIVSILPGLCVNMLLSRRIIRPAFGIDVRLWKRLLTESWPVVASAVFVMVYLRIDQIMLFQMKGPREVGCYAAAVKLVEVFGVISSAFAISVFPIFSNYFVTSREGLEKAYRAGFKCMATLIMPIAVGTFIIAAPVVKLVYGSQFYTSVAPLQILIWSDIFIFLGMVHSNLLIAVGLQKFELAFVMLNAAVNVALNAVLIPRYGMVGAAIASLVSYGCWIPLSYILKRTRPYTEAMIASAIRPLGASVIMGIVVYAIYSAGTPLWTVISAGVLSYTLFIFAVRGIGLSDFAILKR